MSERKYIEEQLRNARLNGMLVTPSAGAAPASEPPKLYQCGDPNCPCVTGILAHEAPVAVPQEPPNNWISRTAEKCESQYDELPAWKKGAAREAQCSIPITDWIELLRLVAQAHGGEKWREADDLQIVEEFDPWHALRMYIDSKSVAVPQEPEALTLVRETLENKQWGEKGICVIGCNRYSWADAEPPFFKHAESCWLAALLDKLKPAADQPRVKGVKC